jgi:hypothetical protein
VESFGLIPSGRPAGSGDSAVAISSPDQADGTLEVLTAGHLDARAVQPSGWVSAKGAMAPAPALLTSASMSERP